MRILYLDLDSMRPDHMGCYDYHRNTTPNMDSVAAEGVTFTRLYASDSPCVPARATFISGKFAAHHGAATHWGPGSEFQYPGHAHHHRPEDAIFTRLLRQNGIRPISFSSFADRHQAWWFAAGWREYHAYTEKGGGEQADEVNATVLPWLKTHGKEDNWFLHVQYWDPHRIYKAPLKYMRQFETDPLPPWPDEAAITEHQKSTGPFSATFLFNGREESPVPTMPSKISNMAELRCMIDGYDGQIRHMDERIGELFDLLNNLGVWDETAVIISADHAEGMGEQGVYGDHCCASESVHHLPAIIRWPGVGAQGIKNNGFVYNADLIATITDLLGIDVPRNWDGKSFAAAVRGEPFNGHPHLVWGHALYSCQRVVRTDRWQFVRTYHPGLFQFPPVQLFDMHADPHETKNVSAEHPDVVKECDHLLAEWHQEMFGHHGALPDPMQKVVQTGPWKYATLDGWISMLRSKGREDMAQQILDRLGLTNFAY
ncbi:sulfatase [Candidatus Poribacteria bacterium]|nr:sulfatase [Candidatus Poribacteria bacterium]